MLWFDIYVNTLLLGDVAQQQSLTPDENRKKPQSNGLFQKHDVELKGAACIYAAVLKIEVEEEVDNTHHENLNKISQQSSRIIILSGV